MAKNYNFRSVISSIDNNSSLNTCSKSLNDVRSAIEPLSAQIQGTKAGEGIDKKYNDIMDLTVRMYNALELMEKALSNMKSEAEADEKTYNDEQAAAAAARAASTNSGQNIDDRGYPSTTAGISTTTTTSYRPTPTYTPSRPSGGNGGYSNYF